MARRARRRHGAHRQARAHCPADTISKGCKHVSETIGGIKLDAVVAVDGIEKAALGSTTEWKEAAIIDHANVKEEQDLADGKDVDEERADDEDDSEDAQEDEDEEIRARQAMLEKLACSRRRRCVLTSWVNRRVIEICNEDADEPDSEDESVRSLLMDALGAASTNVETSLSAGSLELLDYVESYQPVDSCSSSKIHFSDSSTTYIIKPDVDTNQTAVATTCNACWTLDQVLDSPLYDVPSSPLGKWREQQSGPDDGFTLDG